MIRDAQSSCGRPGRVLLAGRLQALQILTSISNTSFSRCVLLPRRIETRLQQFACYSHKAGVPDAMKDSDLESVR